ncbi:MAG TPA: sigma-54-dependent Fis family transcriptional regulator, partial [Desulfuromonadales bacterium]|nr:sigma-54-dependent Fis family transcriptional regulator [Desulfuromonadales bacterium]
MSKNGSIYVVDGDTKSRDLVSAFLTYRGYEVIVDDPSVPFFDTVRQHDVDIVVADASFLGVRAPHFKEQARLINPLMVLIACGDGIAADDFTFTLPKPLNLDEIESLVQRARESQAMKSVKKPPRSAGRHSLLAETMIGTSRAMHSLFDIITKVADSSATVLIQGESGTGKELAARALHLLSDRKGRNFVPVNCAAIPDDLLESELFGHIKGAFTGAFANRAGRFEIADKGTLFLDEIGDMKANLQVKLLRVLQNREIEPVGSSKSQKVDVRIIAATNKNLEEMVESRDFREDLYYRLSVIPIVIPPLRERRDDISLLLSSFLDRFNADRRHAIKGFSRESLQILSNYGWPGNVRELENLVERLVILKDSGLITPDDLPEKYLSGRSEKQLQVAVQLPEPIQETVPAAAGLIDLPKEGICLNSAVEAFENRLILQALQRT